MRIELPPSSWSDTTQRTEDDTHTMTMAASSAPEWSQWQWAAEAGTPVHVEVPPTAPVTITLTF